MDSQQILVIANGDSIGCEQALAQGRIVIALDGAADRLHAVEPDIILGDFDSIKEPRKWGIEATFGDLQGDEQPYDKGCVRIVPVLDQNRTDLQKALHYCKEAASICIVHALGGRTDHTLSNLGCLRQYPHAYIRTATETIRYLGTGEHRLLGQKGAGCALFGFPKATATTNGLAYELRETVLESGGRESTSNQIAESVASVIIDGHALLIKQV